MDWSSLSYPFLVPVDVAAVPNLSLLLPQTASRFPSIYYRGFNHWICLCSPLIECYFYKEYWVKTKKKNWLSSRLPRLLRYMRNRPNIFSIEIPRKEKFYQGQDLKEKIHFPEFQVTWFLQKLKLNDRSEVINSTIRMVSPKTDLFSKWTEPRYHIHQRDRAISLGCTRPSFALFWLIV